MARKTRRDLEVDYIKILKFNTFKKLCLNYSYLNNNNHNILKTELEDIKMTIIPKYETIKAEDTKALMPKQTAIGCVLKADENSGIKNVLSVTCDASLLSVEGVGGEARYSGRVDFKALYIDTSGKINTLTYYADFSDKIEDNMITPVSLLGCNLYVVESEIASVSKEELKLTCVIEAMIKVNNISQVSILSGGEGFFHNAASVNTTNYSGGSKGICEVSDEFEVKSIVKKILLSEGSVILSSVTPGVDSITAEGEAVIKLTYLSGNDEQNNISGTIRILPFKHEIDAKDVLPNDKAFAECIVKSLKVNALVDENKEVTVLNVSCDIEIMAKAYNTNCINYVDDVFSPDCQLNLTYSSINSKTFIASFNYKQMVEGVANLDDDMIPAENILTASSSRIHIANIIVEEGSITAEGIAVTTILYSGMKNDVMSVASVNVEIPFSEKLDMAGVRLGDSVTVNAAIFEVEAKCRKGKEIDVTMQLKLRVDLFTDEVITALSDVQASETEMPKQCSISLYCPSVNESLWDVAKQLCVSPETITSFNPDIKFPVSGNMRIFVYRQKF